MFTDCPGCGRQFRLAAHHLSAAAGEVRCGFCGLRFSALERLRDAPLPAPPPAVPAAEEEIPDAPPAVDVAADEPEFDIAMGEFAPEHAPEPAAAPAWTPRPALRIPEPDDEPLPRRWPWIVLATVLVLAGAAQWAWFNRDALLARYPAFRPRVEQWCARLGCTVQRLRDLSAITVLNRDVREHPRYQDTLLVNATLSNGAAFAQPFPDIELAFSDGDGRIVAARAFAPRDYLDASIAQDRGMEPGAPVHVVLEIAGVGADAASFEIGFR